MKSISKIFSEAVDHSPELIKTNWISPTGKHTTSGNTNIKSQQKKGYNFKGYKSGDPFVKNIKQKKKKSSLKTKKTDKTIPII